MAANEIHIADVGTQFIFTIQDGDDIVNIGAATTLDIIFHKPDGTNVTKTGSLYTDGTDGKITYTTDSVSFLDIAGNWKIQLYIVLGATSWHTDIGQFTVYPNL
jgi:hypothetical protein